MAITWLLLRHVETAVSERQEWHDNVNPPLSSKGKAPALRAAQALYCAVC
jgi:broad specificity phosphatase PhoE